MKTYLVLTTALLSASLLYMAPQQANAQPVQGVRLVIDSVQELSGGNDNVYFVLGGGTSRGTVSLPTIGANLIQPGTTITNIPLYEGFLSAGERGFYTLMLRKRNGTTAASVEADVRAAIASVGSAFVNPTSTVPQLISAATQFVSAVSRDSDKTLGAWAIDVHMPSPLPFAVGNGAPLASNAGATVSVLPIQGTQFVTIGLSGFLINATGGGTGENYQIVTHVETFGGATLTSLNSGMCLDVPNASPSDGVQLQQYTCHSGANQQWLLMASGVPNASPSIIVSVNSGKCVDIRGTGISDQVAVQQFTCHGGTNQQFLQRLGGNGLQDFSGSYQNSGTVFQNVNSGKCIDVVNGSMISSAPVQQYSCFFNPSQLNQMWDILLPGLVRL